LTEACFTLLIMCKVRRSPRPCYCFCYCFYAPCICWREDVDDNTL